MMRAALLALLVITLSTAVAPFILFHIEEPIKFAIWTWLQTLAPIVFASGAFISAYLLIRARKHKLLSSILLAIGLAGGALHFLGDRFGIPYPNTLGGADKSLAIRVPFDGPVKVGWGGDDPRRNYHAAYPDQRWAYDLVIAPYGGAPRPLTEYGCFGKPVLAPSDGVIRTAHDGEPDIAAGENYEGEDVFGNYIVMQPAGTDMRLVLAHLKSGSLLVERDQPVTEGDIIAECGNSGASTQPHLHIHLIDLIPDGDETIMIGQPLYFRDHNGSAMPSGSLESDMATVEWSGETIEHSEVNPREAKP